MTGKVQINDTGESVTILLNGDTGAATVGGNPEDGSIIVRDQANNQRLELTGSDGDLVIKNAAGDTLLHFDNSEAALTIRFKNTWFKAPESAWTVGTPDGISRSS